VSNWFASMAKQMVTFAELVDNNMLEIGAGRPRSAGLHLPVLRVGDVLDGRIQPTGQAGEFTTQRQQLGPKTSRPGDIVLTTKGTVGRVAIMPSSGPTFAYSPQLCYFRTADNGSLDSRYLYYWFQSAEFSSQADALKAQTDMADFISLLDIYSLTMQMPPVDEQRAIAEVLGALDEKIAANQRAIRLADDLSRAHFQAVTADGDEMPLSSLARFVNGRAYTKNATGTGRIVVRIAELNSGIGGSTVWNDIEVPDDNTARPGDLLFAWSGSLTAARWYRPEAIVNQHIFKVIPTDGTPMWLVNQAVHAKLDEFKAIAADKATTMGHIQRRHLDETVRIPRSSDVKKLDDLMAGLWDAALAAEIENLTLTATRDALLPFLMSGRVRVMDAEKAVEEVL